MIKIFYYWHFEEASGILRFSNDLKRLDDFWCKIILQKFNNIRNNENLVNDLSSALIKLQKNQFNNKNICDQVKELIMKILSLLILLNGSIKVISKVSFGLIPYFLWSSEAFMFCSLNFHRDLCASSCLNAEILSWSQEGSLNFSLLYCLSKIDSHWMHI